MATKTKSPRAKKQPAQASPDAPAPEVPDTAPAGGPPSTDSSLPETLLSQQLAAFGFEVPVPVIAQWGPETHRQIELVAGRYLEEYTAAVKGEPFPDTDRTDVPPLLAGLEMAVTAELSSQANRLAAEMKSLHHNANPYPPGSALAAVWQQAFDAAPAPEPAPAAAAETLTTTPVEAAPAAVAQPAEQPVAAVSPPQPAQSAKTNAQTAAELNIQRAQRERETRFRQQKLAVEAAQHDLEEAAAHQAELEDEVRELKADLKEKKSAFDNAGERVRKASRALARARAGFYDQSTLPFKHGAENHPTLEVPDQDIGSQTAAAEILDAAPPPAPAVDEGAFVLLDHLVKGDLQEFIPGTPDDKGISDKQCESLKKIVGETIGDLEKWQKANGGGEWWRKSLKDKGVGLGGAACDKLVEAHEAIRRKFPIPSPDDTPPTSTATDQPAAAPAEPEQPPMDCEVARETLQTIIRMCDEVDAGTTNLDGVRFVRSVRTQASDMLASIQDLDFEQVTADQARAIRNWSSGVEAWHEKLGTDFGDGLDDETGLGGGDPSDDSDDELEPTEDAGAELENDEDFDHDEFEDDGEDDDDEDDE